MNAIAINLTEDREIIEGFSKGSTEKASTAFVRKYQSFVYSSALRYLKDYDDADDAAQEVFIKALANIHKFKGSSSLKTWLYRITVNHCITVIRKKSVKKVFSIFSKDEDNRVIDLPDANPTPEKKLEAAELNEKLITALGMLPEKQRETFSLRYFDELSYEEISDMLGTSVGGLKANYFHAVKKIASIIGQED